MSEKKQQRQTTLFSFFSQPSKTKKKDECPPKKKQKETKPDKDEPTETKGRSSTKANVMVSQPATTKERVSAVVVSPMNPKIIPESPTNRGANVRKRPRPKSTNDQHEESSLEERKVKTCEESKDDQMKENVVNHQHQEVVSSSPAKVAQMPNDEELEQLSSDEESEPSDHDESNGGMSAYELLRQRNIERNNARLASLGLLSQHVDNDTIPEPKKKPRVKRKAPNRTTHQTPSIPTRRSTRTRKSVISDLSDTNTTSMADSVEESFKASETTAELDPVEVEETYTVSPLLQYAMNESSTSTTRVTPFTTSSNDDDSIPTNYSLHPTGPRLAPPKGLKAIYSLDFSQPLHSKTWLVGAGKSGIVALWDCNHHACSQQTTDYNIDPTLTWKAHNGRWIASARFSTDPSKLLTAANDGKVCLWDLSTVSVRSGVPRLVCQSGSDLHASGIFAMDLSGDKIVTGSKDKTVAVSTLDGSSTAIIRPLWKSTIHAAKVGAVQFHPTKHSLVASASDDDLVCVHDYSNNNKSVVIQLDPNAHVRPHSVVWDPYHSDQLLTAGLDHAIKLWDIRNTKSPVAVLQGHVPDNTKIKRIHHPVFYHPNQSTNFVLSGGQGSGALSMFANHKLYSRGKLPADCGDAGCIAVHGEKVAVSVHDGEVLILSPK